LPGARSRDQTGSVRWPPYGRHFRSGEEIERLKGKTHDTGGRPIYKPVQGREALLRDDRPGAPTARAGLLSETNVQTDGHVAGSLKNKTLR